VTIATKPASSQLGVGSPWRPGPPGAISGPRKRGAVPPRGLAPLPGSDAPPEALKQFIETLAPNSLIATINVSFPNERINPLEMPRALRRRIDAEPNASNEFDG